VIREIQTIQPAQIQYSSQFGKFAATLAELGPPANGAARPAAANLIPESLASGEKDGYVFAVSSTQAGFGVHANPKVFGKTGRRTFYSDENGVIRQNWGQEPATENSPALR
jgi:type IV pilus assembly protein PilA